jgi:hypothetical protein
MCAGHAVRDEDTIESIGLKVKKHMILWIDKKEAVDLANNWSVGGKTRHIKVRQYFLCELWLSGAEMSPYLFTKNLLGPLFEYHTHAICGNDEYMKKNPKDG